MNNNTYSINNLRFRLAKILSSVFVFLIILILSNVYADSYCGMCGAVVSWNELRPHNYRQYNATHHYVQRYVCENGHMGNWNEEEHTFKYGVCIYCGYGTPNVPNNVIYGTSKSITITEGETKTFTYERYNQSATSSFPTNTSSLFTVSPVYSGTPTMSKQGKMESSFTISITGVTAGNGSFTITEYEHKVTTTGGGPNTAPTVTHNFEPRSVCTVSVTVLSAHTHSWSWTYNDSQHWQVCSCGETQNTANHNYDTTVSSPTCTENGTEKCSTCGKTRSTAALGHSMGNWYISAYETCTANGQNRRDCQRRLWVL